MGDVLKTLSLDESPEADELVERAQRTGEPCLLTRRGETVAILVPLGHEKESSDMSPEEREALLRSLVGISSDGEADAMEDHPAQGKGEQTYRPRKPTESELARFRSAAGGWADFDADAFLAENRRSRDLPARAAPEL